MANPKKPARREAEGQKMRTCWNCGAENRPEVDACYRCGVWESRKPDAPPPPAPDLVTRLRAFHREVVAMDGGRETEQMKMTREAADAIKALSARAEAAEAEAKRLREAIERYLTAKHDLRQAGKQDEHEPYRAALIEYDEAEQSLSAALAQGGNDDAAA